MRREAIRRFKAGEMSDVEIASLNSEKVKRIIEVVREETRNDFMDVSHADYSTKFAVRVRVERKPKLTYPTLNHNP